MQHVTDFCALREMHSQRTKLAAQLQQAIKQRDDMRREISSSTNELEQVKLRTLTPA